MPDPNPYESPKAREIEDLPKSAKRALSVTAILLCTPLALFIACAGSCGASYVAEMSGWGVMLLLAILGIPPLITLLVMLEWAWRTYKAQREVTRASVTAKVKATKDDIT